MDLMNLELNKKNFKTIYSIITYQLEQLLKFFKVGIKYKNNFSLKKILSILKAYVDSNVLLSIASKTQDVNQGLIKF